MTEPDGIEKIRKDIYFLCRIIREATDRYYHISKEEWTRDYGSGVVKKINNIIGLLDSVDPEEEIGNDYKKKYNVKDLQGMLRKSETAGEAFLALEKWAQS